MSARSIVMGLKTYLAIEKAKSLKEKTREYA